MELVTGQTILDQAMNFPPVLSCILALIVWMMSGFKKMLI